MQGFAEHKVSGGKLVKARVVFGNRIVKADFFGDFFLHPEDCLTSIENIFVGKPVHFDSEQANKELHSALQQAQAQLIGASPTDFILVLQKAIRDGQQ